MFFKNEYRFLSNMVEENEPYLEINGVMFYSTENYYQAMKTTDMDEIKLIARLTPLASKTYGKKLS